ncbi:XRE family transcriptional regulator [Gilvimarinus agarilyticus]|uniref:XRE family transcriptional regulator n=1 Tax=Gilvimarinus agarilyticus TaxID=679259 RepID=UPI0005A0DC19|nr:LexA family transcriptional regulator [Gilvimarinus agarilyticus]
MNKNVLANERISQLRDMLGLSQSEFSSHIGITQGALSQLEARKSKLSMSTINAIHHAFNVNCNWLVSGEGKIFLVDANGNMSTAEDSSHSNSLIPMVNRDAHAGYIEQCNDPDFIKTLGVYKIPGFESGQYRLFETEGDSMEPAIYAGEIVITEHLSTGSTFTDGSLAVVIAEDGIVVKRIYAGPTNKLTLKSDNPAYKPYTLKLEDISQIWLIKSKITHHFNGADPL